ncbi:MAG: hypothetical protein ACR2G4_06550 [Pyrinomonadaceae bacterium]
MMRDQGKANFPLALIFVLLVLCGVLGIFLVRNPTPLSGIGNVDSSNSNNIMSKSAPAKPVLQSAGLALPSKEGAWMIVSGAGGGSTGDVGGGVVITSQGDVAAGGLARAEEFRLSCTSQSTADDLRAVEQVILLAKPSVWNARYVDPKNPDGCCDQLGYSFELHLRKADGTEQIYSTFWYDSSMYLLPKDIPSIYEAAMTIKSKVLAGCSM